MKFVDDDDEVADGRMRVTLQRFRRQTVPDTWWRGQHDTTATLTSATSYHNHELVGGLT